MKNSGEIILEALIVVSKPIDHSILTDGCFVVINNTIHKKSLV